MKSAEPRPTASNGLSRRAFLRSTGLSMAALPLALGVPHAWAVTPQNPNGLLGHACVGVGGMGWNDLQNFLAHKRTQVVALCDVDSDALNKAAKAVPGARTYTDWRELLEKEGARLDSLNLAVPDHMHFPIAYSAMRRGLNVYCQKPMCHDVAEVRALTNLAAKKKVITQLGTQMASGIHERTAVHYVRSGLIGKVRHAYLCSNRPGAVEAYRLKGPRPATGQAPPKNLNWDLWLGTAPVRPYAPEIYHPMKWRAWLDFGTGWSGDIGCHIFDSVWKSLDLKPALSVRAEVQDSWKNSPERRKDTWPQGNHITWTFPGNDRIATPELSLEWFDGEYYPPEDIRRLYSQDLKDYPPESSMLVGTEGALLYGLGLPPQLLPEEKFKAVKPPTLPPRDHYHHFIDACLGGEKTESHFGQTGPMTEAILLGTVAIRCPGETLQWDHRRMKVTNHRAANAFLKREYRKGWSFGGF